LNDFRTIGPEWARDGYHFALHTSFPGVESLEDRYELLRLRRMWGEPLIQRAKIRPLSREAHNPTKQYRIGFLSSDLRSHPSSRSLNITIKTNFARSASHVPADDFQKSIAARVHTFKTLAGCPIERGSSDRQCESVWMGVPVVTLVGETFFERMSYSNLSNCGLYDLCTFSCQGYRDRAIGLAHDRARRRYLKRTLCQQISGLPLGNPSEFVRRFYDLTKSVIAKAGPNRSAEA
jgi:hypothetical protein